MPFDPLVQTGKLPSEHKSSSHLSEATDVSDETLSHLHRSEETKCFFGRFSLSTTPPG